MVIHTERPAIRGFLYLGREASVSRNCAKLHSKASHNRLVGGSSPAGPTTKNSVVYSNTCRIHQKQSQSLHIETSTFSVRIPSVGWCVLLFRSGRASPRARENRRSDYAYGEAMPAGDLDNVGSFNCVNWEIGKGGDNFLELGGFSRSRPDLPAGALRAATGAMDFERENRVGLREIPRVSRREISQAGRDALALARLAILEIRPTQQLHPGPCNFPGSCNPSVMRSNFALA
jgi:hypothetical protein